MTHCQLARPRRPAPAGAAPRTLAPLWALAGVLLVALALPPAARAKPPPLGFQNAAQPYCLGAGGATHPLALGAGCGDGESEVSATSQFWTSAQAGATADRVALRWSAIEPLPSLTDPRSGEQQHLYLWDRTDRAYAAARAFGIAPILAPVGAPGWAQEPGASCGDERGCAFPPSAARLREWQQFVAAAMHRYPDARAFEIWNEPNSPRFFAPRPRPALYARMLAAADRARRASGFEGDVVLGGLAPRSAAVPERTPPLAFLDRVYRIAAPRSFDGIGIHPYPLTRRWVRSMWRSIREVRRARDRNGDAGKPIWLTEVGVRSLEPDGEFASRSVSRENQGRVLLELYRSTANQPDIAAFVVFTLAESDNEGAFWRSFGVVRPDLSPKRAYCELARELGGEGGWCPTSSSS